MSIHQGISCDVCRKKNFSGRRYKCLICHDLDLCSICYEKKSNLTIRTHSIHHPMQLVITSNDYEHIYFGNSRAQQSPMALVCPLCNENGFSLDFLIEHVNEKHVSLTYSVLCPICFIREKKNLSEHLYQHRNDRRKASKQMKIWDSNEKEFKPLLETFVNHQSDKNENQQRVLFIQSLLTDLVNGDI